MPHQNQGAIPTQFRFTKTAIQQAISAAQLRTDAWKQMEFCDTELPNFRLLVFPTGKASYVTRYRQNKRRTSTVHGDYRVLHLENARELHRRLMFDLALGKDPKEAKKAKATFAEVAQVFLKGREGKLRSYADDVQKFTKRLLPTFGKRGLHQITAEELDDFLHNLHTKEGLAAATANRYHSLLSGFFRWSAKAGYLSSDKNPMALVEPFPEDNAPKDCMSEAELARFIDKASEDPNPLAGGLLALIGLTGARLSEWLEADWSEIVRGDDAKLMLPARRSKNGAAAEIPIPPAGLAILEVIAEVTGKQTGPIFPGRKKGKSKFMARPSRAFDRVCAAAGLEGRGFTIHSLRHAFASALANAGVPPVIIQALLRHRTAAMVNRYCHPHWASMSTTVAHLGAKVMPDVM